MACGDGCSCDPMEIDAHDSTKHESVMATAELEDVTQSTDCTLELELLEKTSSREHKFKVSREVETAAMMSHVCGSAGEDAACKRCLVTCAVCCCVLTTTEST